VIVMPPLLVSLEGRCAQRLSVALLRSCVGRPDTADCDQMVAALGSLRNGDQTPSFVSGQRSGAVFVGSGAHVNGRRGEYDGMLRLTARRHCQSRCLEVFVFYFPVDRLRGCSIRTHRARR
jgi:hypothetical protein